MILLEVRTGSVSNFFQLLGVLVIFVMVLGLTYLTTKWIASYQKGRSFNKNLQVVETLKLTTNKYIQIIRAGDAYMAIGIGKDEITFLTMLTKEQLNAESLEELENSSGTVENFSEVLKEFKDHLPKK